MITTTMSSSIRVNPCLFFILSPISHVVRCARPELPAITALPCESLRQGRRPEDRRPFCALELAASYGVHFGSPSIVATPTVAAPSPAKMSQVFEVAVWSASAAQPLPLRVTVTVTPADGT